jgi:leucyl-tRNA synthetase
MSKSRGNVVNPDFVVGEYGADSLRLFEMFMGPLEQVKPWQMKGVEGVSRFLARVWRVAFEEQQDGSWQISSKIQDAPCMDKELLRVVHETIKKVGEDIEKLSFNTAISQMMICTNAFTQVDVVPRKEFIQFLTVLNPFAPHLAEEINARLGGTEMLSETEWPAYDPAALVRSEIEFIIQVNGKLRDRLMLSKDADEEAAKAAALASAKQAAQHRGGVSRSGFQSRLARCRRACFHPRPNPHSSWPTKTSPTPPAWRKSSPFANAAASFSKLASSTAVSTASGTTVRSVSS